MEKNRKIALLAAFYLSKYDKEAYKNLGYHSFTEAFKDIGGKLGVNPNSVKNMRDEFDGVNSNDRAGWYQRPLRPSRLTIFEHYQFVPEEDLREVIIEAVNNQAFCDSQTGTAILFAFNDKEKYEVEEHYNASRGITGKRAEEYFIEHYRTLNMPISGVLVDTRHLACGYDFIIKALEREYFIEIKGLAAEIGGISFTNKEWELAKKSGNNYFLIIVSNIQDVPKVSIVQDPASKITPKKTVQIIPQVNWLISSNRIREYLD